MEVTPVQRKLTQSIHRDREYTYLSVVRCFLIKHKARDKSTNSKNLLFHNKETPYIRIIGDSTVPFNSMAHTKSYQDHCKYYNTSYHCSNYSFVDL